MVLPLGLTRAVTWITAQGTASALPLPRPGRAEQHFYAWLVHCADAGVPELQRLARTLDSWHDELLAYFDTDGISNGPTESDQSPDQEDQARIG